MTRTSVAIFTDNDFEKVNGVTTALSAVLDHAPDDVDVRVYTAAALGVDSPDYLALESWGVGIPFYPEMRMYWPPYRRMLDRLAQDGVDVIHVTTPGPVGLAALAAARRLRLPLVGSFHTDLAEYTVRLSGSAALGAFIRHYMTWLYGRCERVLVPSRATVDLVVRAGLSPDHVAIWGRGVDTSHFEPARRSVDWRRRWRAPADRPVLLYVGRVSPEKGVDLLPDLHDELMRRGLNHRLVVVGDGPARETLARRCPDAICLGTLGRQDLADVYASADLFVFPSRTDTAGNVVLEAQASGLPVLVSDAGGPREQMQPDVSGLVCGPTLAPWVEAAASLLTDRPRRLAMAAAARRYAESRHWAHALAPLFDTYRTAASGRRTSLAARGATGRPQVA